MSNSKGRYSGEGANHQYLARVSSDVKGGDTLTADFWVAVRDAIEAAKKYAGPAWQDGPKQSNHSKKVTAVRIERLFNKGISPDAVQDKSVHQIYRDAGRVIRLGHNEPARQAAEVELKSRIEQILAVCCR